MITNFIQLDFNKENDLKVPSVQYDSGSRFVKIKLQRNKSPFEIDGYRVTVVANKVDGTEIMNDCTILDGVNGIVQFEITEQFNAVEGVVDCQLKLFKGETLLTSMPFSINVVKSVSTKEIVSSNELKTLVNALGEVQNIDNRFAQTNAQLSAIKEHCTGGNGMQEHSHVNKTVLDKFAENNNELYYDNKKIGSEIENGVVELRHLNDSLFVAETCEEYSITGTAKPFCSFSIAGIQAGEVINVSAEITVLNSDNGLSFEYRIGHHSTDNGYSDLIYTGLSPKVNNNDILVHTKDYEVTKPDEYLSVIIHTSATDTESIKFRVKWKVTHRGQIVNMSKTSIYWSSSSDSHQTIITERQNKGNLATYNTLISKLNELYNQVIDYLTDGFTVNMNNLDNTLFEIGKKATYTVDNGSFAFISLDISAIPNKMNKVINVEYIVEKMDNNFKTLSNRMATGNRVDEYQNAIFAGSIADIGNNKLKVTSSYTISSGDHTRFNLYPQISCDGATTIVISDVNCSVENVKLDWVEGKVFGGSFVDIEIIPQVGSRLAKFEWVEEQLKDIDINNNPLIMNIKSELEQLRGMISGVETAVSSILNGKKWGVVGDSITFGTGTTDNNVNPYCYLIGSRYLLTINRSAMPGKTLARRPTYNDTLLDNLSSLSADCDYITIFGGTNDYGNNIPLGNKTDDTLDTFYGALNLFCKKYYNNFYKSKFAFLTPIRRSNGEKTNTVGLKLSDYVNAIKEICDEYGIPYLDLYNLGMDPNYSTISAHYVPDGLHPNDAGHDRLSNHIAKFLESL